MSDSRRPAGWPEKWRGKTWGGMGWSLTEAELLDLYHAVPLGDVSMRAALGISFFSDPKADNALQRLRKAGLIRFTGGRWEQT